MLKGAAIRQSYLDFFKKHQHLIVDSAPVVPHDDPTLMFTNAGMNQFKPYFLGSATPEHRRIADTQKCIRVSGKHNDLEEVGYDTYHHTFFEMLGNWSFGDYYKKEAIQWAWELFTEVWKLPKDRLHATVFGGDEQVPADEEAVDLWKSVTDINPHNIHRCSRKDNFWMMGDTGPCGPCSEIHIDLTPDKSGHSLVNAGSPLVMELWNLVFIQFNAEEDRSLRELPAKHVDTGMGFERACAVMECTNGATDFSRPISNYDTEVFQPIIRVLQKMSGAKYTPGMSEDMDSIAMRVIADHIRMISFAIADGALPSNEGRGYVVRRLLRRAARYARKINLREPFLYDLVPVLKAEMGATFPELVREESKLQKIIKAEEESFNVTLDRGIHLFEDVVKDLSSSSKVFPAPEAFKLYDTFGFPFDLTEVMAREKGLSVSEEDFKQLMEGQKAKARAAQTRHVVSAAHENLDLPPTPFVGYDHLQSETEVKAVLGNAVVLAETPFYGEMGGQLGDHGWLELSDGTRLEITNTTKSEGVVLHHLSQAPASGAQVKAVVDAVRRQEIQRHHTATHLLHWALHEVLGDAVRQQGSLVAPERLRFDFTHYQAMEPSEIATVERLVNERILENHPVSWFEIDYKDKPDSVTAFFGDKYGARVRVVKIGGGRDQSFDGFSMELCGGTHTLTTAELGPFRLQSEGAIAAGVRRIEAVTGTHGLQGLFQDVQVAEKLSRKLGVPVLELESKVEALLETQRKLNKQLEQARRAEARAEATRLLTKVETRKEIPVVIANLGEANGEYLKWVADSLRDQFKGVAVLAGVHDGRVALLASVDKSLNAQGLHAGKLIKDLASKVGGGGGGRPDLAEAGGKDPSKLAQALAEVSW
ncbi:alanine--tRNA ligase [bacterium]|nr:alanine--tRNA ligase [bacterium]